MPIVIGYGLPSASFISLQPIFHGSMRRRKKDEKANVLSRGGQRLYHSS
jgi:hypothetical protein